MHLYFTRHSSLSLTAPLADGGGPVLETYSEPSIGNLTNQSSRSEKPTISSLLFKPLLRCETYAPTYTHTPALALALCATLSRSPLSRYARFALLSHALSARAIASKLIVFLIDDSHFLPDSATPGPHLASSSAVPVALQKKMCLLSSFTHRNL